MLYICLVAKDHLQHTETLHTLQEKAFSLILTLERGYLLETQNHSQVIGGQDSGGCLLRPPAQSWANFQHVALGFSK